MSAPQEEQPAMQPAMEPAQQSEVQQVQQPAQQPAQPAQQPAQPAQQPVAQQLAIDMGVGVGIDPAKYFAWSPSLWKFINIIVIFLAFILCCVGTTEEQVCKYVVNSNGGYGTDGPGVYVCTFLTDFQYYGSCIDARIRTAYAFAVLACVTLACLLVVSVAVLCVKAVPQIAVLILAALSFFWLLISWPLSSSVTSSGCSGTVEEVEGSPIGLVRGSFPPLEGMKPSTGLGLLITAWIFALIAVVLEVLVFMKVLPPMMEDLGKKK